MNKYQKALTYIEERHGIFLEGTEKSKESFYALEELIEKHEQLEKALEQACLVLERNILTDVEYIDEHGIFYNKEPVHTRKEWRKILLKNHKKQ